MSWQEDLLNKELSIKTGDGEIYKPLWKGGEKRKEYKHSVFDFIDVEGDFIDRKKAGSAKYDLVFYFQGEDHFNLAETFEESADDPRAWQVEHPYYGFIVGQPLSIKRGNKVLNRTEIQVEFWETIEDIGVKQNASVANQVDENSQDFAEESAVAYESKAELNIEDLEEAKTNLLDINLDYNSFLDDLNYSQYQQAFNSALQSVDNLLLLPGQFMNDINTLIGLPASLLSSVEMRLDLLGSVFDSVKNMLGFSDSEVPTDAALNRNSKAKKAYFEAVGGAVISSICKSVVNLKIESNTVSNPVVSNNATRGSDGSTYISSENAGNSTNTAASSSNVSTIQDDIYSRTQIRQLADAVIVVYNEYLDILDKLVVPVTDIQNSFSVSFEPQNVLDTMVSKSLFNLYAIAFDAKQERQVILEADSNLIILTHKYIGLDDNDINLERFRKLNNIKNRRVFRIPKGKTIKYFI